MVSSAGIPSSPGNLPLFNWSMAANTTYYIEPLKFKREAAVLEGVEQYKCLQKNHPNRKLVESARPNL